MLVDPCCPCGNPQSVPLAFLYDCFLHWNYYLLNGFSSPNANKMEGVHKKEGFLLAFCLVFYVVELMAFSMTEAIPSAFHFVCGAGWVQNATGMTRKF